MNDETNEQTHLNDTSVAHQLGLLTGTVQSLHAALTTRIDDIRADVRALEVSQRASMENIESRLSQRITGLEASIGHRVDGLESRVGRLEEEDKNFLKASSKAGGVSGGVVGALVSGGIELIKVIGGKVI
jgi:hypothetical protein